MDIVCYSFHTVGEFFTAGDESPVFIAFTFAPAVIDDKIIVAGIKIALVYHCVRCLSYERVAYVVPEGVP